MRHPHGLRAAAAEGLPSAIGVPYQGGFFTGYISHTANSVATHGLILAPNSTIAYLVTKTSNTDSPGTDSVFNGSANSANMNDASHPAAEYCENLSSGGYSDWYLPARYELEIAYFNLKPVVFINETAGGSNIYSVPARGSNYTVGTPAQTTVTAFQSGNSQAFANGAYATSTQQPGIPGQCAIQYFLDGTMDFTSKNGSRLVRAFRKFAL